MPTAQLKRLDWTLIQPDFRDKVFALVAACNDRGAAYFATSGYRAPTEQLAIWAKGRNAAGAVVDPKSVLTYLKFSWHCTGLAVDLTRDVSPTRDGLQPSWEPKDYAVLAEEAVKLGLEAGYNWTRFCDPPHIQFPTKMTIGQAKALYDVGGLKAVWAGV